ncbi:MAG: DUF350 domain-containing protein [bacterium]
MSHRSVALEPGFGHDLLHGVGALLVYAALGAVLIAAGFVLVDLTTPGRLNDLVARGRPNAVAVAVGGAAAIAIIVVTCIFTSGGHLLDGLISTAVFGLVGILALVLAMRALEFVLRIDVDALLHDEHYRPTSIALAATHVALGLIIAASLT